MKYIWICALHQYDLLRLSILRTACHSGHIWKEYNKKITLQFTKWNFSKQKIITYYSLKFIFYDMTSVTVASEAGIASYAFLTHHTSVNYAWTASIMLHVMNIKVFLISKSCLANVTVNAAN